MDILKTTPEVLAEYMNFLLAFSRRPGDVIGLKTATTEGVEPAAVSGKLVMFSLLSVGAAIVIVQVGAALGMAEDRFLVVKVAGGLDEMFLPVAVLVAIMALSAMAHVVLRVVALLEVVLGHEPFRGSIAGSVNAALGFAAWSIPLMTAAICIPSYCRCARGNAKPDRDTACRRAARAGDLGIPYCSVCCCASYYHGPRWLSLRPDNRSNRFTREGVLRELPNKAMQRDRKGRASLAISP